MNLFQIQYLTMKTKLLLLVCLSFGIIQAQDSLTLDIPLVKKLDYMAQKAEQLDTVTVMLHEQSANLANVVTAAIEAIGVLDSLNAAQKDKIVNLELENSILIKNNTALQSQYSESNRSLEKCEEETKKKDTTITKLKASRNNSVGLNIGFGSLLVILVAAIITDNN